MDSGRTRRFGGSARQAESSQSNHAKSRAMALDRHNGGRRCCCVIGRVAAMKADERQSPMVRCAEKSAPRPSIPFDPSHNPDPSRGRARIDQRFWNWRRLAFRGSAATVARKAGVGATAGPCGIALPVQEKTADSREVITSAASAGPACTDRIARPVARRVQTRAGATVRPPGAAAPAKWIGKTEGIGLARRTRHVRRPAHPEDAAAQSVGLRPREDAAIACEAEWELRHEGDREEGDAESHEM